MKQEEWNCKIHGEFESNKNQKVIQCPVCIFVGNEQKMEKGVKRNGKID